MKIIKLIKLALSIRAWKKSRTIKAASAGGLFGGAIVAYPPLIQICTDIFNYVSPVDLTTDKMSGLMLFVASIGAALLRADTSKHIEDKR